MIPGKSRLPASLLLFSFSLSSACAVSRTEVSAIPEPAMVVAAAPAPEPVPEEKSEYPGRSIVQIFPPLADGDISEEGNKNPYEMKYENYNLKIDGHTPKVLQRDGKNIFRYKVNKTGYWSSGAGVAHLLGEKSTQIYFVNAGDAGVCCVSYWIVDISAERPREIFRSEDYGRSLYHSMEIFDIDNDGIYEIEQSVSSFRYFMGDCGSCSPEPRAVFKYDKNAGKYLPAKGITQPFLAESREKGEKELIGKLKSRDPEDLAEDNRLSHWVLEKTIDHIYAGNEANGWRFFNKYYPKSSYKEKVRREIRKILDVCPFYKALYRR